MLQLRKQLRTGGAIQIINMHFHGENLHSYGRSIKLRGGFTP